MNENGSFKQKKIYFSQVSNEALRDSTLSLKAKGLYSLIQSYITIENFILYKNTLKKQCIEGDKAFESTWKELKDKGYLLQYKYKKSDGTFSYEYELLDICNHTPKKEGMDNAGMEKAHTGKGGKYNKTSLNNTNLNNTKSSNYIVKDKSKDKFNSYHQRTYDGSDGGLTIGDIENKLLGWEQ